MSYYALPSLNVSFSRLITSVVHERTGFIMPSITLTFVVSVLRTSSALEMLRYFIAIIPFI